MYDLNLALYMRETSEAKQFFKTKSPPSHMLAKNKLLYIYLRVTQTMAMMPMFFDKFVILYKPIESRSIKDLTWHGIPILELTSKATTPIPSRRGQCKARREWVYTHQLKSCKFESNT